VVKAFKEGREDCEFWEGATTVAAGLRVPKAYGDYLVLKALRESHGTAVAVSDAELLPAMKELAQTEGIWACPEGAATLACIQELRNHGFCDRDEKVLLYNTGSGILYSNLLE